MRSHPLLENLDSEVHIWLASQTGHSGPELLARYYDLLSPEEKSKYTRFHFERDRLAYLVTHGFLRTTLSKYAELSPSEWVFTHNRHGRPEIVCEECLPPLRFNVSRTRGMVACIVALSMAVGVDIENVEREIEPIGVSEHSFCAEEVYELKLLPRAMQKERFFSYWTLKEAYAKALGLGLSLQFNQFRFETGPDGIPRIRFEGQGGDPLSWQFYQFRHGLSHIVAAALQRGSRPDLKIRIFAMKTRAAASSSASGL